MSTPVFIYSLSHPETGEVRYVGLTRDARRRMRQYQSKGHTKHLDNWLKSIRNLGMEVQFSVLETVEESGCDVAERKWIAIFRSAGANLLNFTDGGERSCTVSEETRKKLSATWTPERRQKISEGMKARWTPERKKRFSELRKGKYDNKKPSRFIALNKSRKGIPLSEERKLQMSISRTGVKHVVTDEGRRRMSESAKSRWKDPALVEKMKAGARRGAETTQAIFRKREHHPLAGRKLSDEHRAKVSEGVRRSQTPEYRRKMSEIKKGVQWSPMTEEKKAKISASLKGRKLSPEQVEQRRQAFKLRQRDPVTGQLIRTSITQS